MNNFLFIFLSLIFTFPIPQDEIQKLKNSSSGITGQISNSIYQQERIQFERLINILNIDVLGFYELKNQYNTDSRRNDYQQTEDYKSKYSSLKELNSETTSQTFFLDFEPDYFAERSIGIKYNTENKSFSVSNDVSFSSFYNVPDYIQFDHILMKCPAGITVSKRNINYACVDVVEETISFEIANETLVQRIDEEKYQLRLLFVFKITGSIAMQGKTKDYISSDYFIMTELQEVIAYNSKTGEIYSTYK